MGDVDIDTEITLYDANKQIMCKQPILDMDKVEKGIENVVFWLSGQHDDYFMLLCHERRDYTLINFIGTRKNFLKAGEEVKETLWNRGDILDIGFEEGIVTLWVLIDEDAFLYHLFPFNMGVIEI